MSFMWQDHPAGSLIGPYKRWHLSRSEFLGKMRLGRKHFLLDVFSKYHTQNRFYYYINQYYVSHHLLTTPTKHNQNSDNRYKFRIRISLCRYRRKLPGFCCYCLNFKFNYFKTFTREPKTHILKVTTA